MRVHLSRHARGFTVLPNLLLQDRRLTFTARGLLADLLSRPDAWREDGRHMADTSPQGRHAVAKALRELTAAGYYQVVKVRLANGTFVSEAHVYDTPQAAPQVAPAPAGPVSGGAAADLAGSNPVKDLEKEPTLPAPCEQTVQPQRGSTVDSADVREGGRAGADKTTAHQAPRSEGAGTAADAPAHHAAAQALLRVVGTEPRLRLGAVEAMALAPEVTAWLERGWTEHHLADALLAGLPQQVHNAPALLRDRLVRKLPPLRPQVPASGPAAGPLGECPTCGDPVRRTGICRACAGLGTRTVAVGGGAAATRRGASRVRAALRPTRGQLTASRA